MTNLSDPSESRKTMMLATNVLMKRYDIERDRASALLVKISERSDVSVEALARRVLATAGSRPR